MADLRILLPSLKICYNICEMRPIATDTADFPSLRKKGCIYVDKTMYRAMLNSLF